MNAVILAAGYGTRLYPLTQNTAKPLIQVGGRTILDYLMDHLIAEPEIRNIILVTNGKFNRDFEAWKASFEQEKKEIPALHLINDESTSPENRLGAIRDWSLAVSRFGKDDMIVSAADDLFLFSFKDLIHAFGRKKRSVISLVHCTDREKIQKSGNVRLSDTGRVMEMVEKPEVPVSDLLSPCLYLLRQEDLPLLDRYIRSGHTEDAPGHFISWFVRQAEVYGVIMEGPVHSVGDMKEYRHVQSLFEKKPPLPEGFPL